jgi:hypothetical protein
MAPAVPAPLAVSPSGYTVDRSFALTFGGALPTLAAALAEVQQHVGETVTELLSSGGDRDGASASADIRLDPFLATVVRLAVMFIPPPGAAVPCTDRRLRAALLDPQEIPTTPGTTGTYSVRFYRNAAITSRDEGFLTFTAGLAHAYDHIHALTEDLARYRRVSRPLWTIAEVRLAAPPASFVAKAELIYEPPDPDLIPPADRELAQALRAEGKAGPR